METRAYRLHLRSPLHVGDQGIGSEVTHAYMPSDTLFSALAVTWRTIPGLQPTLEQLLAKDNPPLLISSAFPFADDVLLLPKPLLPHLPQPPAAAPTAKGGQPDQRADDSPKRFRRVRWVSHTIFTSLLAEPTADKLDEFWHAGKTVQGGAVWVTAEEHAALRTLVDAVDDDVVLWSTGIVPRVAVDRISSAGQIHHTGRAGFAAGGGLWFLAQAEAEWLDALETVLAVLGDEGMGGKRSVGSGQFTCEKMQTPPALPQGTGNCVVLLSRTAPAKSQMALLRHSQAAYELVLIGGFNGTPGDSPLVRRQVRMLTEGSIIGAPNDKEIIGRLVDVTPTAAPSVGHTIWRSGLGFAVRVQMPAAEGATEKAANKGAP